MYDFDDEGLFDSVEDYNEPEDGDKAFRVGYSGLKYGHEVRVYAESLEAAEELSRGLGVEVQYIRPELYHEQFED